MQASYQTSTRRSVLGGAFLLPAMPFLSMSLDMEGQRFEGWEAEIDRLHAQAELIDDTDLTNPLFDRAHRLDGLIRDTPARSRRAIAVKTRWLIRYADDFDGQLSGFARHVAQFVAGIV